MENLKKELNNSFPNKNTQKIPTKTSLDFNPTNETVSEIKKNNCKPSK
jgi:hypothetical protein